MVLADGETLIIAPSKSININSGHIGNFSHLVAFSIKHKRAVLEIYVAPTHDENLTFVDGTTELVPRLERQAASGLNQFPLFLLLLADRCNYL